MKLNDNLIDYTLPTSKPIATASVAGKLFDSKNKFWELEAGDTPSKLVNAIEIDWNGAQLSDAISSLSENLQEGVAVENITTTAELLKVIAQLQAQVNTLTTLVKGLYSALTTS